MKNKITMLMLLISAFMLTGCSDSVNQEKCYTENQMQQANDSIGFPAITNFTEKEAVKTILELRDDPDLTCYCYIYNTYLGGFQYIGECVGYGIPYGLSITNPDQYISSGGTVAQAEPNGLYTNGVSNDASWVMMKYNDGTVIKPFYIEDSITVSPEKIEREMLVGHVPEDY